MQAMVLEHIAPIGSAPLVLCKVPTPEPAAGEVSLAVLVRSESRLAV